MLLIKYVPFAYFSWIKALINNLSLLEQKYKMKYRSNWERLDKWHNEINNKFRDEIIT